MTEENIFIINGRDVFVMFGAICVAPYLDGDQLLVSNVRLGGTKNGDKVNLRSGSTAVRLIALLAVRRRCRQIG